MKRTIFIIIGSTVLFLIFSLWLYLLLFGTPAEVRDAFTNFGLGGREATPISNNGIPTGEPTGQVNISSGTVSQLTTKPVAGFGFVQGDPSDTAVLYAERGTGHVYRIDLATGVETRLLQKTFMAVNRAFFAPDGSATVLIGNAADGTIAHLEELDNNRPAHQFPEKAENIAFVADREVRYTLTDQNGTIGYSYKLDTAEIDQLFEIPLSDVKVIWTDGEILLYSRPTPTLRGSLYRISGSSLSKVGGSGYSFSAMADQSIYIETSLNPDTALLISSAKLADSADEIMLGVTVWSDKCSFDSITNGTLWCAAALRFRGHNEQSAWYKGTLNFSDLLWRVDLSTGEATAIENLIETTGRAIDVLDLTADDTGSYLLFKNKIDDTLWLKRLAD